MNRYLSYFLFALILSFSSTSYAGWVDAGSYGGEDQILLDDKIKPVADLKTIYPNIYTVSYKISMQGHGYVYTNFLVDIESGKSCPLPGRTEMLTLSDNSIYQNDIESVWEQDPSGLNHWTFAAYLWKNKKKIDGQKPYAIAENLKSGLTDRTPKWAVRGDGWIQVYEKSTGNKAWIQTKSVEVAPDNRKSILPSLQVLIRREVMRGTEPEITYSLERYDPDQHTRTILRVWQDKPKGKGVIDKELPVKTTLPAQVPNDDSAIATTAYFYDILHSKSNHNSSDTGFFAPDPKKVITDWIPFK